MTDSSYGKGKKLPFSKEKLSYAVSYSGFLFFTSCYDVETKSVWNRWFSPLLPHVRYKERALYNKLFSEWRLVFQSSRGRIPKIFLFPFVQQNTWEKKNSLANFLGCSRNVGLFYTQMMKEDDVSQVFYFIFFFIFLRFREGNSFNATWRHHQIEGDKKRNFCWFSNRSGKSLTIVRPKKKKRYVIVPPPTSKWAFAELLGEILLNSLFFFPTVFNVCNLSPLGHQAFLLLEEIDRWCCLTWDD